MGRPLTILMLVCAVISAAPAVAQPPPRAVYVNIRPDFVTNFDEGARLKYLKASVSLKVEPLSEETVRYHLPSIKNRLIILFSAQAEENLTSTVGRETLRREALHEVKLVMAQMEREGAGTIEDLYFTNFVIQQ